MGILHSTATLSIQSAPMACMGLGSCTVSIFSSPTTATRLGRPLFFRSSHSLNPNLSYSWNICTLTPYVQALVNWVTLRVLDHLKARLESSI
ncbi:hypothetical protein B0H10DRAFT_746149 [Mycena sp. CBHHK59/15]|nr:hypothetical protein B0H10DRAFT_746149 [Mycena sp. CBHHK59/15]